MASTEKPAGRHGHRARQGRRTLRTLRTALVAVGVAVGLTIGTAGPAGADINTTNGGIAYENVNCDYSNHTVSITFNTNGEDTGVIGGSDLFPRYEKGAVYVTVWEWARGQWGHTAWTLLNNNGVSSLRYSESGTSYWYFSYAFATPDGRWDMSGEWAGGTGTYGWYSDQNGYQSLTSCYS